MSLKAAVSAATSVSVPRMASRRPGCSGSTERIVAVSRRRGAMTSRSSSMLRTTEPTKPTTRITAWVSVTG